MDREQLAIDLHQLEEEWVQQPLLYESAAETMANEMRQRDEVKTDLETLLAQTAIELREEALVDGKKMTESGVQERIAVNEHVIRQKKLLNHFNHTLQQAKNDLGAIDTKKRALEYEVQLYIGQYFSVPKEGKEVEGGKRFTEEVRKEGNKEHQEIMKEKKKVRLGKFSDPVTSEKEKSSKSDEEKLEKMSPAAKEKYEETIKDQGPKPGKESPRRRRRR